MGTGLEVAVGVTLTNGVGCTGAGGGDAEGLADGLVLGALAVKKLSLSDTLGEALPAAVTPLLPVQAAVVARTLRAPQPRAVTFAPGRAHAVALPTLMEPPDRARHKGSAQQMACFSLEY
jgi:hypothetical protein